MRRALAIVVSVLALPASARDRSGVAGDGKPTTERRDVPAFDRIELDAAADVTVRVGPERSVSVTIDGDLQRLLLTAVRKGTLVISSDENLQPRGRSRVDVTVPSLRGVELAGSGDVRIDGGAGPLELAIEGSGNLAWNGEATELRAAIDGSGDVRLEGRADALRASVEGSGNVSAGRLRARDVSAKVEGSGDVDVTLDGGALSVSVDGSGNVTWRGQAKVERISVSGSGGVARKE